MTCAHGLFMVTGKGERTCFHCHQKLHKTTIIEINYMYRKVEKIMWVSDKEVAITIAEARALVVIA